MKDNEIKEISRGKLILVVALGHFLELYDYTLYVVLLPFFAQTFFPSNDANISILLGYLSFAIAIAITPISSIFWGWYGDKFGRSKLLAFSIILMALPSFAMTIMPGFASIGIFAPIAIFLIRFIHGISASAEILGSKLFLMEHLGDKTYGFVSGLLSACGALGVMSAMFMGFLCSQYREHHEVWRYPFLLGALLFMVAIIIRKRLSETKQFMKIGNRNSIKLKSFITVIKSHPDGAKVVFILGAMIGMFSYFMHSFINPFIVHNGHDQSFAYLLSIIAMLTTAFSAVMVGWYNDFKLAPKMLLDKIIRIIAYTFLPIYAFMFYCKHHIIYVLVFMVFGFLLGLIANVASIVMYLSFPIESKCRGVLLCYTLGGGIFGGLIPLCLKFISTLPGHFNKVYELNLPMHVVMNLQNYLPGILFETIFVSLAIVYFSTNWKPH